MIKITVIAVVCTLLGVALLRGSGYMIYKDTPVTVVDKMMVPGGRGSWHLCLVMKLDNGKLFDQSVSVTAYSVCEVGKRYIMQFRPFDIEQTFWKNVFFYFLPVFLFVAAVICFVGLV